MRPLGALVDEAATRDGDREALTFEDRRWTFAAFRDEVNLPARALLALGVAPGDRVAVWMPNRPEWLQLLYAVAEIGGVLVPINTRLRAEEAAYAGLEFCRRQMAASKPRVTWSSSAASR